MKKRNLLLALSLSGLLLGTSSNTFQVVHAAINVPSINVNDLSDGEINTYYQGVSGKSGDALQSALHEIIDDHESFTYSETVDIMKITDRDWDLSPLEGSQLVNYQFTSDTGVGDPYLNLMYGANYNGTENAVKWSEDHTTIWNKEHIWAKSHGDFGESEPAGTDLHHLRAADQGINNFHNYWDFGIPTIDVTTYPDERGNANSALRGKNEDSPERNVFLPPEEDRGDVARALFYMPTRYYEFISQSDPKLELVNEVTSFTKAATATETGKMGWLKVLLDWHENDPVSDYEIHRNNIIYNNFQGNRNPFIDHPEWARMIYDSTYSGAGASLSNNSACTIDYCSFNMGSPVESISVKTSPKRVTFYQNETFDSSGLVIAATLTDGNVVEIDSTNSDLVTNFDNVRLSNIGTFTVNVTYSVGGASASTSYQITVVPDYRKLISFEIDTTNFPTTYQINETLDLNLINFNVTYSDDEANSNIISETVPLQKIDFKMDGVSFDLTTSNLTLFKAGTRELSFVYQLNEFETSAPKTINISVVTMPATTLTYTSTELGLPSAYTTPVNYVDGDNRAYVLNDVRKANASDGSGIQMRAASTFYNLDPINYIEKIVVTFSSSATLRNFTLRTGETPLPEDGALIPIKNEAEKTYTYEIPTGHNYFYFLKPSHTLYLDSISLTYSSLANPVAEAEDFISHFLSFDELDHRTWANLGAHYNYLSAEAKDYIYDASEGRALQTKQHYLNLLENDFSLSPWLTNSSGTLLPSAPTNIKQYTLVKNVKDLLPGSEVIISASPTNNALMASASDNANRSSVEATFTGSSLAPMRGVALFSLEEATTSGLEPTQVKGWTLKDGSGYLATSSNPANNLITSSSIIDQAIFGLEIASDGKASITSLGEKTNKYIRFDETTNTFRSFSSSTAGQDVYLYQYLTDQQAVELFVLNFMAMDSVNEEQCLTLYAPAKAAFNNLTAEQRNLFISDNQFIDAFTRLQAWANHHGDTIDDNNNLSIAPPNNVIPGVSNEHLIIGGVIAVIVLVVIIVLFINLRKRKSRKR